MNGFCDYLISIVSALVLTIAAFTIMKVDADYRNKYINLILKVSINIFVSSIITVYFIYNGLFTSEIIKQFFYNLSIGIDHVIYPELQFFVLTVIFLLFVLIIFFLYLKNKKKIKLLEMIGVFLIVVINTIPYEINIYLRILVNLLAINFFIIEGLIQLYSWLQEPESGKARKISKHYNTQFDIKKLTFLWTIIVFILGLIFNIKK